MSDFTISKTVKAAKRHKCEHCRGRIMPGTFYVRTSGVYEGDAFAIKAHAYCEEIRNKVIALCKIEYGDEMLDLPDEIFESLHCPGMIEMAINYNAHAVTVGGVIVDLSDVSLPNVQSTERAGNVIGREGDIGEGGEA